ncbi:DUF1761 family protein [Aeromicrobium sp.]|uniref:DUF1761 family protein n=1 Tax=Aeromicrobium sp. TaxID=1871063 RepID=UPI003517243E
MIDAFSDLDWIAIALAIVVSAALGGVYFGVVIAKPYLRALGRGAADTPAPTVMAAVGPVVCIAATVLTSAVLVAALDLRGVADALEFGLVVGVGYLVAMTFQIAINPNFPHPLRYGMLNAPYFLLSSVTSSLLLVLL